MVCIAVTQNGHGDVWLVDGTSEETFLHPLVQYGDAIMSEPTDLMRQFNYLDLPEFLRRHGLVSLRESVLADIGLLRKHTHGCSFEPRLRDHCEDIWRELLHIAKPILSDPEEICERVKYDRINYPTERTRTMADTKAEPKTEEPKAPRGFPATSTIKMLSDKEGKKYGGENNPKRAGSKSHDRFASYKDGMTVQAFLDAGGNQADLKWDAEKSFIEVVAAD